MKIPLVSMSALLVLLSAPLASSDEGWVDVKVNLTSNSATPAQLRQAQSMADAFARFAANAQMKLGSVPEVQYRYEGNEYRFYFNDPTAGGQRKYIRWADLMAGRWITN